MPRYRYALDEPAVVALGACEDAAFHRLILAFEILAEQPRPVGHTRRTLRGGHVIDLVRVGDFDIAFHADHERRRVWILEIHRV